MHHLDVPWVPAHIEQRDGRGWRHGNENKDIEVYRYVTQGSLDEMFWQVVAGKQHFITQAINNRDPNMREMKNEETESLTPEQVSAIASGNPKRMRQVQLEDEVQGLQDNYDQHTREQNRFERKIRDNVRQEPELRKIAESYDADIKHLQDNPEFSFVIDGTDYKERKEAQELMAKKSLKVDATWANSDMAWADKIQYAMRNPIGTYRGMTVYRGRNLGFVIKGLSGHEYDTGDSLQSLEYVARNIKERKGLIEKEIAANQADVEKIRSKMGAAYPKEKKDELESKKAELAAIEQELSGGKEDTSGPEGQSTSMPTVVPKAKPIKFEMTDVRGPTYENRERIKAAGGRWDAERKVWTVPKLRADELKDVEGLQFGEKPPELESPSFSAPSGPGGGSGSTAPTEPTEIELPPLPPSTLRPERKEAIHAALKLLHGNNPDMAREINNIGFNKIDSQFARDLAESDTLTDRQAEAAAKMLLKYKRQIPDAMYELIKDKEPEPTPEEKAVAAAKPVDVHPVIVSGRQRHVHNFRPGAKLWDVWKSANRPDYLRVKKLPSGWIASIWGATPEEVQQNANDLRTRGVELSLAPTDLTQATFGLPTAGIDLSLALFGIPNMAKHIDLSEATFGTSARIDLSLASFGSSGHVDLSHASFGSGPAMSPVVELASRWKLKGEGPRHGKIWVNPQGKEWHGPTPPEGVDRGTAAGDEGGGSGGGGGAAEMPPPAKKPPAPAPQQQPGKQSAFGRRRLARRSHHLRRESTRQIRVPLIREQVLVRIPASVCRPIWFRRRQKSFRVWRT